MQQERTAKITAIAVLIGVFAAIASGRLPRWARVFLVIGLILFACGACVFVFRFATHPVTLTVAVGSIDGDAPKLMSAIAARLASTNSSIRLKIVDKGNALDAVSAFSSESADLAVARSDIGDLSSARAVVVMTHAVVLVVVPPGSPIESMDDLKGKTVGVVAYDINKQVVTAVSKAYDLDGMKVQFKDIPINEVGRVVQSKQVQALLVVMPIAEKYLTMLRDVFPRNAKSTMKLVPIESAGAIAAVARAYESYDLPKGAVRGSPAVPDEDLTTLRIPFFLIANRKLNDGVVAALTKAVVESRRDLLAEYPVLGQVSAPGAEKDAYIPIHPGAASYFEGEQQTILEKYGDQLFYASMVFGSLASILAAVWKFMMRREEDHAATPLARLQALKAQIDVATSDEDLVVVEKSIDDLIDARLATNSTGEEDSIDTAVLGLAIHRLERLLERRRTTFHSRMSS